jgi:hypothetical protein
MHLGIRSLSALALGLALTCTVANAQLLLSGHTTGSFDDLAEANTTVTNSADGSWATFRTGVPASGSTQSSIEFTNVAFNNVGSGEPIQVGLFEITNGMTNIGSGAPTARFNVGLQLTSPEWMEVAIATINFHIDHTPNLPNTGIPDTFAVSFEQPAALLIQDFLVQFHVNVDPLEFQIAENATITKGDITVSFTPVPEPSTYAAWGAALLVGFVAFRRIRGNQTLASVPASA